VADNSGSFSADFFIHAPLAAGANKFRARTSKILCPSFQVKQR
jgi:hypothetical protein